ncbi:2-C-methyl-D-erythritol 2,4-cyclodiphosphate synthase [Candidatus Burkholderia pumila]|uniref:2-C-methyl-D-erythritol 2,4-cyclodiphosphate synthase n=1 Tax=Candidatus Burkholderia pumila TaxID=1090375 RepID=A0ABR5HL73_9BURK|nr:2-C-methyl-D-erythritol 2,4-cyclodiphosphate synthase [Candidatus Burkholderia pumila]
MDFRIGQGYDVHQLVEGWPLIIGGVTIPYELGLLGHSDADVLLHAITDALFGAASLGDVGRHFLDTATEFKGADSRVLLREAMKRVTEAGFAIQNVDSTVIAQAPKLAPHIEAMRENIAADLEQSIDRVNVKAKTNEKLGYLGRKKGIEAQAAVLLRRTSIDG